MAGGGHINNGRKIPTTNKQSEKLARVKSNHFRHCHETFQTFYFFHYYIGSVGFKIRIKIKWKIHYQIIIFLLTFSLNAIKRHDSRIIVGLFYVTEARKVLCQASALSELRLLIMEIFCCLRPIILDSTDENMFGFSLDGMPTRGLSPQRTKS